MKNNRKSVILLTMLSLLLLFLSRCINNQTESNDPRGKVFAGSETCKQCHQDIFNAYLKTSHYNATKPATINNIHGSFNPGHNVFSFGKTEKVVMEKRNNGLFQVDYINGGQQQARRFDIIFGQKHAQTFLYYDSGKVYELPVSYFTSINTWGTSPGFPADHALFNRAIGKECFECHSSYISSHLTGFGTDMQEVYDKSSLIYGIDCERCHGPGANHVNFHLAYPKLKQAKYMVAHTSLSRQQSLDMCAVCHSGNDKEKEVTTFRFRLGDTLANYFSPWSHSRKPKDSIFDVHGKQYQLLASSQCFIKSKTLTCITCHDPHADASGDLAAYSAKCLSCHKNTDHSFVKAGTVRENEIIKNCIDCHMPEQSSQAITFNVEGSTEKSSYLLRTHKIAIYSKAKR